MRQFRCKGYTISSAKFDGKLECVIESMTTRKSKTGNEYLKPSITDGLETAPLVIWSDVLVDRSNADAIGDGKGISVSVTWSDRFRSFTIVNGTMIIPLVKVSDQAVQLQTMEDDSHVPED